MLRNWMEQSQRIFKSNSTCEYEFRNCHFSPTISRHSSKKMPVVCTRKSFCASSSSFNKSPLSYWLFKTYSASISPSISQPWMFFSLTLTNAYFHSEGKKQSIYISYIQCQVFDIRLSSLLLTRTLNRAMVKKKCKNFVDKIPPSFYTLAFGKQCYMQGK